jgi:outer membrane protein insertion porin family
LRTLSYVMALALILLAAPLHAQDVRGKMVSAVKIEGLERVSEQVVRARIEVQAGQEYNPRAVARDINRLYEMGFFGLIQAHARPDGDQLILTYQVEEKQVIDRITIAGNKKLKARRIRGVLSLREGDSFVPEAYENERKAILDLYEGKGFANTKVDMVVEKVGASRVRVLFNIEEGRKARIRSIQFVDHGAVSERQLKRVMKTRPAWWFLGGRYEEDKFEQDLQNIVDEYGNHGRLEAQIPKTDLLYTENGKKMDVTIHINQGPQYTVDTLDLASNNVFDDDEILDIIVVEGGDIHNKGQVAEDADLIQRGYQDSGYIDATVTPLVTLDRDRKTTHVVHQVNEGELKYIREIDVTGNEVTKDEVVRREMLINPGDRFDGAAVKASQRRLENTRYFDLVRIYPDDFEEDDLYTNLLVDVDEGKTGNFNFGVGYSSEERLGVYGQIRLNNFDIGNWPTFSGGGQQLLLRANIGDIRDEYSISFTEPELFGYPIAFGFDVFDESYRVTQGANYREQQQGVQLRFGKSLSPYVTARTSIRYTDTDLTNLPWYVNRELRNQRGSNSTIANMWQIERNTLDNYREPSAGAKHILSAEVAGFGADNEYIKFEHDSTWYRAVGRQDRWVLSLRTRHGWMTEYGSSDSVPLQDRFYAGGATTVRGYKIRDIGPKVPKYLFWGEDFAIGGNARIINNLEAKYKVTEMFRLYAFVDSGGVWSDESNIDLGDIKYSAGLGFGVDVPRFGPIRIDYGIPINPDKDQGSGRLHLQTGFSF